MPNQPLTFKQIGFALVCLLVAFAAYWSGLSAPFIFDSTPTIRDNPLLRFHSYGFDEWLSATLSSDTGPLKRPFAMFTFAVNAAVSGLDSAFPFNLTNLLIHCCNAMLVFVVVRRLYASSPHLSTRTDTRGGTWIGLITAAIFLLHPLQLPAVLHTVQRMSALSFTFVLVAVALYLPFRKQVLDNGFSAKSVVDALCLVGFCIVLGALAKENALLTPWLLLVIEAIFFRFRSAGHFNRDFRRIVVLALLAPIVALVAYLLVVRPELLPGMYVHREFTLPERLLTQAKVLWIYIYWMVVPSASMSGLHHDDIAIARSLSEPLVALSVLAWCALAVLISTCLRRFPLLVFAFAWYLIAHAMESSFLPLEMVYEHRNYAAILGFAVALADALWLLGLRRSRRLIVASVGVMLVFLTVPLAMRASLWGDEMALAADQLHKHPDSLRSRYHFANLHLRIADNSTDPDQQKRAVLVAEHYYGSMLELAPQDLVALVTLLYIDGKYLGRSRHTALYNELLEALGKRVLSPTDYNALAFFKDCSVRRYCAISDDEYTRVVARVASRSEVPSDFPVLMRSTYIAETAQNPAAAAGVLTSAPSGRSQQFAAYQLLVKWQLQSGDVPAAVDTLRQLYMIDKLDSQLANMRRVTASMQVLR